MNFLRHLVISGGTKFSPRLARVRDIHPRRPRARPPNETNELVHNVNADASFDLSFERVGDLRRISEDCIGKEGASEAADGPNKTAERSSNKFPTPLGKCRPAEAFLPLSVLPSFRLSRRRRRAAAASDELIRGGEEDQPELRAR